MHEYHVWALHYVVTLVGLVNDFAGFFIQARTESNSDSLDSIVGTWAPSVPSDQAITVPCNGDNVSLHYVLYLCYSLFLPVCNYTCIIYPVEAAGICLDSST